MLTLVIGGAASGKSEFAEDMCRRNGKGSMAYVATMAVRDEESRLRVERHRHMRREAGFETVEHMLCSWYRQGAFSPYGAVLLECASNLLANEMYMAQETAADAAAHIMAYIARVGGESPYVVVVSNDVFGAGDAECCGDFTREYLKALARINQALADKAERVIEVVYGIPVFWKDEECD